MQDLADRVIVVTGSAQGIGYGIARRLGRSGAIVVAVDRNGDAAASAGQRLRDEGYRAVAAAADISMPGEIEGVIEAMAEQHGRLDGLVNNAGIWDNTPFENISIETWRHIFAVNVEGTFRASQSAFRIMKKAGYGRIVNIASAVVGYGPPLQVHYTASKAALIGLTRGISAAGGPFGITANVVAPGLISTEGVRDTFDAKDAGIMTAMLIDRQDVKRIGSPDDIAEAVAYFVRPEASFTSGQSLFVEGGHYYN